MRKERVLHHEKRPRRALYFSETLLGGERRSTSMECCPDHRNRNRAASAAGSVAPRMKSKTIVLKGLQSQYEPFASDLMEQRIIRIEMIHRTRRDELMLDKNRRRN
jgi:hypothetical protein